MNELDRSARRALYHVERESEPRAETRRVVRERIEGSAFLRRLTRDAGLLGLTNLGALSRFQTVLREHLKPAQARVRNKRLTKLDRLALHEIATKSEGEMIALAAYDLPAPAAELVYRIALAGGVSPKTASAALVCYGLERLAAELRASKIAPAVVPPKRAPGPTERAAVTDMAASRDVGVSRKPPPSRGRSLFPVRDF